MFELSQASEMEKSFARNGYNPDTHIHFRDRNDISLNDMKPMRTARFERDLIEFELNRK